MSSDSYHVTYQRTRRMRTALAEVNGKFSKFRLFLSPLSLLLCPLPHRPSPAPLLIVLCRCLGIFLLTLFVLLVMAASASSEEVSVQ